MTTLYPTAFSNVTTEPTIVVSYYTTLVGGLPNPVQTTVYNNALAFGNSAIFAGAGSDSLTLTLSLSGEIALTNSNEVPNAMYQIQLLYPASPSVDALDFFPGLIYVYGSTQAALNPSPQYGITTGVTGDTSTSFFPQPNNGPEHSFVGIASSYSPVFTPPVEPNVIIAFVVAMFQYGGFNDTNLLVFNPVVGVAAPGPVLTMSGSTINATLGGPTVDVPFAPLQYEGTTLSPTDAIYPGTTQATPPPSGSGRWTRTGWATWTYTPPPADSGATSDLMEFIAWYFGIPGPTIIVEVVFANPPITINKSAVVPVRKVNGQLVQQGVLAIEGAFAVVGIPTEYGD